MRPALINSCEASLVRNISVLKNCFFREIQNPTPRHVNLHDKHYFFFSHQTKVSISCPGVKPTVIQVEGLYSLADVCEMQTPDFTVIAEKHNTVKLSLDLKAHEFISNISYSLLDHHDKI